MIHESTQEAERTQDQDEVQDAQGDGDGLEAELAKLIHEGDYRLPSELEEPSCEPDHPAEPSDVPASTDASTPARESGPTTTTVHMDVPTDAAAHEPGHTNSMQTGVMRDSVSPAPRGTKRAHDDVAVNRMEPGSFSLPMDDDIYSDSAPAVWVCENAFNEPSSGNEGSCTTPSSSGVENVHRSTHDSFGEPPGPDPPGSGSGGQSSHQPITTIFEAMQWPSFHSEKLLHHFAHRNRASDAPESDSESDDDLHEHEPIPGIKKLFRLFDSVPFSTAFSGVDSPGTGLSQQVAELNYRITTRNLRRHHAGSFRRERELGEPIHINAVEWFTPSQVELKAHPSPPKCLFTDITHFQHACCRSMKSALDATGRAREVLSQVFRNPQAIKLS